MHVQTHSNLRYNTIDEAKMISVRAVSLILCIACLGQISLAFSPHYQSERPTPSLLAHPDELSRREAWQHAAAMTTTASGLMVPRSAIAAQEPQQVPTIALGNSDLQVSRTIQGHWQLAGGHGKIREDDALANMQAHYKAGITTLDTADIYGPSELIVGKFMGKKPAGAVPCTKFCCFRFLDEIDRAEVRQRIQKVRLGGSED